MEQILSLKSQMTELTNKMFTEHTQEILSFQNKIKDSEKEVAHMSALNLKLVQEINEKDKVISQHEKTMHDYSVMINKLQEKNEKELNEKEKHSMLRQQDKHIKELTDKIKNLEGQLEKKVVSNKNVIGF